MELLFIQYSLKNIILKKSNKLDQLFSRKINKVNYKLYLIKKKLFLQ